MSPLEVVNAVKHENYRMPKPKGLCTDYYYSIMCKCWNEKPEERPNFDLLYHIFNNFVIITEHLHDYMQHF